MKARSSRLLHPSGIILETPLLVPSFSSKAFGFGPAPDCRPEVLDVVAAAQGFLTRTCLISAYDLHHGYIKGPTDLGMTVDLMFLDSGGYEVSDAHDLSAVEKPVHKPLDWDSTKLAEVWNKWPAGVPAVFVSYDHSESKRPVEQQLREAAEAAASRTEQIHSFLLKPQRSDEGQSLEGALRSLSGRIDQLAAFQMIGVTEKELASSPLERMVRIARLRKSLDEANVKIPIHVFGALDPLLVCLYFVAGAEIFDGLTWTRYGYRSGQCVYWRNLAVEGYGAAIEDDAARVQINRDNLRHLDDLELALRNFARTGDWASFPNGTGLIRDAATQMDAELERSG
jgi:hypothetical protein